MREERQAHETLGSSPVFKYPHKHEDIWWHEDVTEPTFIISTASGLLEWESAFHPGLQDVPLLMLR